MADPVAAAVAVVVAAMAAAVVMATAAVPAPTADGPQSGNLATQRAAFKKEIEANPKLKDFVIDAAKHEGGVQSNLEQIFNYAAMRHMTINQALHSGQYGPVTGRNRDPHMGNISAKLRAQGAAALEKVYGGSNITDYATDQGMAGRS